MPLRRPIDLRPLNPPLPPTPAAAGPTGARWPPAPPPAPQPPPSPANLRATAQDLARAAQQNDRLAREILGHVQTLCDTLHHILETSERRRVRGTLRPWSSPAFPSAPRRPSSRPWSPFTRSSRASAFSLSCGSCCTSPDPRRRALAAGPGHYLPAGTPLPAGIPASSRPPAANAPASRHSVALRSRGRPEARLILSQPLRRPVRAPATAAGMAVAALRGGAAPAAARHRRSRAPSAAFAKRTWPPPRPIPPSPSARRGRARTPRGRPPPRRPRARPLRTAGAHSQEPPPATTEPRACGGASHAPSPLALPLLAAQLAAVAPPPPALAPTRCSPRRSAVAALAAAAALWLTLVLRDRRRHVKRLSTAHGSVEVGSPAGLLGPRGLRLGQIRVPFRRARLLRLDGEAHLLTLALTGSGKGIGVVLPNLLDYPGRSSSAPTSRGEAYAVTARYRRDTLGHTVAALDPFGVTTAQPAAYNPSTSSIRPGLTPTTPPASSLPSSSSPNLATTKPFWEGRKPPPSSPAPFSTSPSPPTPPPDHLGAVRHLLTLGATDFAHFFDRMASAPTPATVSSAAPPTASGRKRSACSPESSPPPTATPNSSTPPTSLADPQNQHPPPRRPQAVAPHPSTSSCRPTTSAPMDAGSASYLRRAAFHHPESVALVREALQSNDVLELGRDACGAHRYTTREYLEAEVRLLVACDEARVPGPAAP